MKFSFIFCFLSMLHLSASVYSQKTMFTLESENQSVKEILNMIENQSEFRFFYNDKFVDMNRITTVKVNNQNIYDILNQLFNDTPITYQVLENNLIVITPREVVTQGITITGTVTDDYGAPMPGVNVTVKGSAIGRVTDQDGKYSINVPDRDVVLMFSFVGFVAQEFSIGDRTIIDVILQEDLQQIEEVVVVGYGTQSKKLFTGATVQIGADEIVKKNNTNFIGALQSQSPGVMVTQMSGVPGEDYKVTIRGIGTVGNSNPLYVIDGFVTSNLTVSPSDIERIDILKDAASAAIYGNRGANGIILITTKKGSENKTEITYDGYVGWSNLLKKPRQLNAREYMDFVDAMYTADGKTLEDWASFVPRYNEIMAGTYNGTDWIDEFNNKDALKHGHDISIRGGNKTSKYSAGVSYTSSEGIFGKPVEPFYDRLTVRFNSEHVLIKNSERDIVTFGENITYGHVSSKGMNHGARSNNVMNNILIQAPILPMYNDEGEFSVPADINNWGDGRLISNPISLYYYQTKYSEDKNNTLRANVYLNIVPVKDLTLRTSYSYQRRNANSRRFIPKYAVSDNTYTVDDVVRQSMTAASLWQWDATATYVFNIAQKHRFDVMVGASAEKSSGTLKLEGSNVNPIMDGWDYAWLDNTKEVIVGKTSVSGNPGNEHSMMSGFGRINYNYDERYVGTFVMRGDASSRFARGHRWGYFPSVSAGWVVSQESFMESTRNWIDMLKLRVSWGRNGNEAIDDYQYLSTVSYGTSNAEKGSLQYTFGTDRTIYSIGSYYDLMGQSNITWETSEQIDIGFDARFMKQRLGVVFDWYRKETKDWLVNVDLPATAGRLGKAAYQNAGDIVNKGFELAIDWRDHIGEFNYHVNINGSINDNEVTRIANSEGVIHSSALVYEKAPETYRAEVGYPVGYFWGYKTLGVFQNQAQIDNYLNADGGKIQPNATPGDLIYKDVDGNGNITDADKTMIGQGHPKFTLGINIDLNWKGFDFAFSGYGFFKKDILKVYSDPFNPVRSVPHDIYEGYWHGEGTSNKYPRISWGAISTWNDFSDIYIKKGNFFRASNITLGYDFARFFKKDFPIGQFRIYASVQNAFVITNYDGFDPEVGPMMSESWASGIDIGYYPRPRTFLLGINIKY